MKRLILLVAIVLMAINMAQAQDSMAVTKKAERKSLRALENSQPWKTRFIVGANLVIEARIGLMSVSASKVAPNFGASFEAQFTRHSGLETGLYYRNIVYPAFTLTHGPSAQTYSKKNQRYLSLPVMYKYYSRILNFAVGFNVDYMVAHTTMDVDSNGKELNKLIFGVMLKLTKDIVLTKGLILEPSLHFNPYMSTTDERLYSAWLGGTIGIKYRF